MPLWRRFVALLRKSVSFTLNSRPEKINYNSSLMSYDLLCYPSLSGAPQNAEAEAFYSTAYRNQVGKDLPENLKQKIATALMQYNPRLQPFEFDYTRIAQARQISQEEARRRYRHIELNALGRSRDPTHRSRRQCGDHDSVLVRRG